MRLILPVDVSGSALTRYIADGRRHDGSTDLHMAAMSLSDSRLLSSATITGVAPHLGWGKPII